MRSLIAVLVMVGTVTACAAASPSQSARSPVADRDLALTDVDQRLSAELERISRPTLGQLGVSFRVLEDGRSFRLHGDEAFPMASVYKFPIALAVLAKVDRGELLLDQKLALTRADLSVPHSPIAENFPADGRTMTIAELLEAMIVTSDNTACDVLLRESGGPAAVTAHLRRLGIQHIRVDRTELAISRDLLHAARPQAVLSSERDELAALERTLTEAESETAWRAYWTDPRDTATPEDMVTLLARFHAGETLSAASTSFLRALLERPPPRLGAKFPPGVTVAHKTGTGLGSFNDVGLVALPDRRHLVLAVFLKQGQNLSLEAGSRIIADVGRAVYDAVLSDGSSGQEAVTMSLHRAWRQGSHHAFNTSSSTATLTSSSSSG